MKPTPYWQSGCGRYTLYCGDCREILPHLEGVDAVVTDPPYGIDHASNHVAPTTTAKWMNKVIANDGDTSARDEVIAWANERPWAAFGTWKLAPPRGTRGVLIWDKGPASGMGDLSFPWKGSWEEIYIGGEGWAGHRGEGVLKNHWIVTRASMGRVHPNEKPVSLMRELVSKTHAGANVLDPFAGSGPTLLACIQENRSFIGVEIDEGYCAIAKRRIMDEANHLFAGGAA